MRATGIEAVGTAPWGTHFCQFYATKDDLLDTLVPYFKAGLEGDEFCMWVTSPPLGAREAWDALARAVPDLDSFRRRGRIEIIPHTDWYLAGGKFDQERVLKGWVDKLEAALARGCSGLRLTGNTFWLEKSDWKSFAEYEAAVDSVLGRYRMLALCTYSLERCGAAEIADVIKNHRFALIKRDGAWNLIESFDRRRMQETHAQEIAVERERLAVTLHSIGDAVIATDTAGRVLTLNRVAEDLTGWSQDEALGKPLGDVFRVVNERTGAPAEDPVAKVLGAGAVVALANHTALVARDGTRLSIEDSAAPIRGGGGETIGVVLVFRDVTAARLAEERLRESEERYRRLFENLSEGFALHEMIFDEEGRPADYRFVEINSAFERMTGLTRERVLGRTLLEVLPGSERLWIEKYGEVVRTGQPTHFESRARELGRDYEVIAFRPRPGHFAALFLDVTERKRMEEALREGDRRKNEFLAMLSHELRNPLAPLQNSVYVLDQAVPGGEQARRARAVIRRQVDQLTRLVDDLLDVTRITRNKIRLQRQVVELNVLVRRAAEDQRSLFEKSHCRLELALASHPIHVDVDATRIAQVVGNLLQNAAKFTPAGGTTTVRVSAAAGRKATISVTDTGVGMSPQTIALLFQPFMQAENVSDRSKGGLGLGLSLVKGLVEQHGGEVRARSEGPGKGSEFVVSLPLAEAPASPPRPDGPARDARPRRVLIIEDDADAADTLREALTLGGHEVEVAYDGPNGLARARELRPEVVLCDIGLPGMTGYEVARAIRADEALESTFLVALTGYASPDDLQRVSEAGFELHLAKPFGIDKLEALLGSLGAS